MRKLLLLLFTLIATTASAQLTVNQWGQVRVGHNCDSLYEGSPLHEMYRDTLSSLWVSGPSLYGNPARIIFGDAALGYNRNVDIGERYDSQHQNTNQLHLHGNNGIYCTFNPLATYNLLYFDQNVNNNFVFTPDIQANGFITNSDARLKKDVKPLDEAVGSLSQLTGVSYTLKTQKEINDEKGIATDQPEMDEATAAAVADLERRNAATKRRFGFIAQQVREVYPELVHEDAEGYLSVDYIGLIPILVNAVNGLNEEVTELKDENAALRKQIESNPEVARGISTANSDLVSEARLYQNTPNPFSTSTTIKCALPANVARAQVMVFDLQGKLLKTLDVAHRGITSVTLEASELPAGMYVYALIADGTEVATKRMILTK